jgi:hypothetical protein
MQPRLQRRAPRIVAGNSVETHLGELREFQCIVGRPRSMTIIAACRIA